jgi:hypothetical protein
MQIGAVMVTAADDIGFFAAKTPDRTLYSAMAARS